MGKAIDLATERRISNLIDRLGEHIASHPEIAERTYALLDGELPVKQENTVMISIRYRPIWWRILTLLLGK